MVDLAKLVVKLEAQSAQYLAELEKANRKLDAFGKKTEFSLKRVSKATAVLGLGVAGALTKLGLAASQNIDEFGKMSERTGVSTEALSQLGYVAKLANTDIGSLEKGMIKLSKAAIAASTGSDETQEAFRAIGVSVKDASGKIKSNEQLLLELADGFERFEDGPAKAALALKLLGKSGVELVPFLNQGSAAIRELMGEADAFGQTVSGDAAKAADQFNDNLDRLKLAAQGVVNQAFQRLLPALADYTDEMIDGAKETDNFNRSVEVMVNLFKLVASGAVIVKGIFSAVGQTIGLVAAAAADAFKGFNATDFAIPTKGMLKLAKNIMDGTVNLDALGQGFKDVGAGISEDISSLGSIWEDEENRLTTVRVSVKRLKEELNFRDVKLDQQLAKQTDAAVKKLSEINTELQQQVATFGMGETAVTAYSLSFGKLADEVDKAGDKGKKLADSILDASTALEKMKNASALADIDVQILQLTGHFKEAAAAAFDLQNKALMQSLGDTGDTAGQDKVRQLRQLTIAQADFNALQDDASRVQQQLANAEQRIQNEVIAGTATELEAAQKTTTVRQDAVAQLTEIEKKLREIAVASGNPELIANVEQFSVEVESLSVSADQLSQMVKGTLKEGFGDFFKDLIKGTKSAEEAFMSFLQNIGAAFADLIAQNFAEQLIGSMGGTGGGGGSGGGWIQAIASLFSGTMDSGGRGRAGEAYMIGTGAQPEMFVPGVSGQFIPRNKWMGGGLQISQNFAIQAPQGTVSRATQLQVGADAARGIQLANRRNNR